MAVRSISVFAEDIRLYISFTSGVSEAAFMCQENPKELIARSSTF